MIVTKCRARVVRDNSGVATEIPTLVADSGPLETVTKYVLHMHLRGNANSTIEQHIASIAKFIEYIDANSDISHAPSEVFSSFVERLSSGTIDENGNDPSGLYWNTTPASTVSKTISHITDFTDYIFFLTGNNPVNPQITASSYDKKIQYAAYVRKKEGDFLAHTKTFSSNATARQTRLIRGKVQRSNPEQEAKRFPEKLFNEFLIHGLATAKDPRIGLRDMLICLLMHGAGLRVSEALGLWVTDVFEDKSQSSSVIVRIYDEVNGAAPNNWKSKNGLTSRKQYLKERYSQKPREEHMGTSHIGEKIARWDNTQEMYCHVHFFPSSFGELFKELWFQYLPYRAAVEDVSPYAFINFNGKTRGKGLNYRTFVDSYERALARISMSQDKDEGRSPHGHRHAYGQRLKNAGVDPLSIQRLMHHASIESQQTYTVTSFKDMSAALSNAELESDNQISINDLLSTQYFSDVDPLGLLSGQTRLKRMKK